MLVGEFPKEQDLVKSEPFAGGIGFELGKMLAEAGIHRETCFATYVVDDRVSGGNLAGLVAESKAKATSAHTLFHGKYVTPRSAPRQSLERTSSLPSGQNLRAGIT